MGQRVASGVLRGGYFDLLDNGLFARKVDRTAQPVVRQARDDQPHQPGDVDAAQGLGQRADIHFALFDAVVDVEERNHRDKADGIGGDATQAPVAVDVAVGHEEVRDGVAALAHEEIVREVDRGPGHQEVQHHHQVDAEHRQAFAGTLDAQGHAQLQQDHERDGEDPRLAGRLDVPDRIDTGQGSQLGAVDVHRDHRQERQDGHHHDRGAHQWRHGVADLTQGHQHIGGVQVIGQPATDGNHPRSGQRSAEKHHGDQLAAGGVLWQVTRVVRHVGGIGDVVTRRGRELRDETGPVEAQRCRGRFALGQRRQHGVRYPAHQHRQGHQAVQRQRQAQRPFEAAVHPVMAEDRQHRRRKGHRHRDHRGAETEQRVQALHHQHQVDDVEPGKHEQRRQQHQDHPTVTELRAGLDHLWQAEVRALRTVKCHEQRAEHDAQGAGECGPERGQADAWADEADGHGEEGEIAEEPERALARQFVGALVLGDEVNRMPLDDGFVVEGGDTRGGLGVSVNNFVDTATSVKQEGLLPPPC